MGVIYHFSSPGDPPVQGDGAPAHQPLGAHGGQAVSRRPDPLHFRREVRGQDRGHRRVLLDPRHLPPGPEPDREAEQPPRARASAYQQTLLSQSEPAPRHVFLSVGSRLSNPPGEPHRILHALSLRTSRENKCPAGTIKEFELHDSPWLWEDVSLNMTKSRSVIGWIKIPCTRS